MNHLANQTHGRSAPSQNHFLAGALYHEVRESCLDVKRGGFRFRIHCR